MSLSAPFTFIKGTSRGARLSSPFVFIKGVAQIPQPSAPFYWTQSRRIRVGASIRVKQLRVVTPLGAAPYLVAALPSPLAIGYVIFVVDESGGPVMAFSDGQNWRRYTDWAVVS